MVMPTDYQLSGHHIHVGYSTVEPGPIVVGEGPPYVTYQDHTRSLRFNGKEVETVSTYAGQLVSVVIVRTVDVGDTTFSFFVPDVNLADQPVSSAPVHSVGITTIHRTSFAPSTNHGQLESYSTIRLTGTATYSRIRPLADASAGAES